MNSRVGPSNRSVVIDPPIANKPDAAFRSVIAAAERGMTTVASASAAVPTCVAYATPDPRSANAAAPPLPELSVAILPVKSQSTNVSVGSGL